MKTVLHQMNVQMNKVWQLCMLYLTVQSCTNTYVDDAVY